MKINIGLDWLSRCFRITPAGNPSELVPVVQPVIVACPEPLRQYRLVTGTFLGNASARITPTRTPRSHFICRLLTVTRTAGTTRAVRVDYSWNDIQDTYVYFGPVADRHVLFGGYVSGAVWTHNLYVRGADSLLLTADAGVLADNFSYSAILEESPEDVPLHPI